MLQVKVVCDSVLYEVCIVNCKTCTAVIAAEAPLVLPQKNTKKYKKIQKKMYQALSYLHSGSCRRGAIGNTTKKKMCEALSYECMRPQT